MVWLKRKRAQAGMDVSGTAGGGSMAEGAAGAQDAMVGSHDGVPDLRAVRWLLAALALCCMFLAVSGAVQASASSGGSPTGSVIDSGLVGELVELVKQVAGLFSVFPINVFLIGSLAGLGFSLFRKAKRTAVD